MMKNDHHNGFGFYPDKRGQNRSDKFNGAFKINILKVMYVYMCIKNNK